MIDKFNFYDVYGYFIPGAALLLLLWLPFGLIKGVSPPSDLGSAVIGIVISYIAGHLLHMICRKALPSTVRSGNRQRNPSDMVVDWQYDKYFSKDLKTNLAAAVQKELKLDLQIKAAEPTPEIDKVRSDAFSLARHVLQHQKETSYAEQYQGMYTLTRGLTAAFAAALPYYAGWAVSVFHNGWIICAVVVVITVSLLAADNFNAMLRKASDMLDEKESEKPPEKAPEENLTQEQLKEKKLKDDKLKEEKLQEARLKTRLENWGAGALLVTALGSGYLLGQQFPPGYMKAGVLGGCAMGALLASLRCYMTYKSFTFSFATTVWRDFYSSIGKEQPSVNDPV